MAYELCTALWWQGGGTWPRSHCPVHLHSQPCSSPKLAPAPPQHCSMLCHHLPGQGTLCHGRWLFAGTCTCFSSGQALSQRGSYQSWRLRDCSWRLGCCSRRCVWCVAVHKQQPAENTSPSGQWGCSNCNTSARKANAGRKRNKHMRHFSHFLRYMCSKKIFFTSCLLPCCPQPEVHSHRRTCVFERISSSGCGCPNVSYDNALWGDLKPRFRSCTEVQISLSRTSRNYRFLSVPCPNNRSFEVCPGLLGRRSAGLRSEPQGESFESWTRAVRINNREEKKHIQCYLLTATSTHLLW